MVLRQRIISLALVGALCAVSLAGCGGGGSASKAAGNTDDSFNKTGLPISKKQITLNVLTTRWGSMGDSFKKNAWLVNLEKETNIKINWQVQSLNDWNEQKSILLSSKQLPDIVIGSQTFSSEDVVNNQDMFRPLDDLITKYMPNYQKALKEYPELKRVCTYPDGKMYSLGKNLPCRPTIGDQPIINKAWLEKLNLKVPTNITELENVLKAFKEKDPNGNGKADELPIIGTNKKINMHLLDPFMNMDPYDTNFVMENGKPAYKYTTEGFKAGVQWLHKLYQEGLIDKEAFTADQSMDTAKNQNANSARVGFEYAWTPDSDFGKWSNQYEAIAPIAGPNGERRASGDLNGFSSITGNEVEITTSCKHPEIAARWLDQFYTNEASIQNFWGAIGTVITKNSNGTYQLNDPPKGTSADAWYWDQSLRDFGPKYVEKSFQSKIKLSDKNGDGLKLKIAKLGEPYLQKEYYPASIMHTEDEYNELPSLVTDIENYVDTTLAKWVTSGGVETGWDAYKQKLDEMGLSKYVKIQTDAYNRYLKVK
jgi:putative aldouronate transport system substrate-binding protein